MSCKPVSAEHIIYAWHNDIIHLLKASKKHVALSICRRFSFCNWTVLFTMSIMCVYLCLCVFLSRLRRVGSYLLSLCPKMSSWWRMISKKRSRQHKRCTKDNIQRYSSLVVVLLFGITRAEQQFQTWISSHWHRTIQFFLLIFPGTFGALSVWMIPG